MSMTRSEAVSELDTLAANLETDLSRAQTRDQHLTIAQRITTLRGIISRLQEPAA